ncbi:hypothetical protein HK405_010326 [Cladochytrium tenue]|nr:hypothetical protein HK405_010326 [Cladochytrium tenue]
MSTSKDAKAAVNLELKRVCEDLILETARAAADPIASFMIKVTAFRLRADRAGKAAPTDPVTAPSRALQLPPKLADQPFAAPHLCVEAATAFRDSVRTCLGPTVAKMADYLGDKRTEAVLVLHMKSNVLDAYTSFHGVVTQIHDPELLDALPSVASTSAFIDSVCEPRSAATSSTVAAAAHSS